MISLKLKFWSSRRPMFLLVPRPLSHTLFFAYVVFYLRVELAG